MLRDKLDRLRIDMEPDDFRSRIGALYTRALAGMASVDFLLCDDVLSRDFCGAVRCDLGYFHLPDRLIKEELINWRKRERKGKPRPSKARPARVEQGSFLARDGSGGRP
jgi:hypothetical protein